MAVKEIISLEIKKRGAGKDLLSLRKTGSLPAVCYGPKSPSTSISIPYKGFIKALRSAGETGLIHLTGDGIEADALIYDFDRDPVTTNVQHVDFYIVEKGKKLVLDVPLEFTGVAPAVRDLGGILVKVLHEVKVEADPRNLPHAISVDVSSLTLLDSQILAKDLQFPAGVELKEHADEVVASITVKKEEIEEPTVVDLSTIEVEKKGKKEEEGAATGEAPTVSAEGEKGKEKKDK